MIDLIRGDSREIGVTFKDKDGDAINLTNATVFFTVSRQQNPDNDDNALITKDVSSHDQPETGRTVIKLTPEDTDVNLGSFWYDVQLVDVEGNVLSKKKDKIEVIADITRRTA